MCSTTYTKEIRFADKAFDGGWVTRWWRDVGGAAENEGWTESVGEDGKVGVHEDIAVDTSRNGMLDGVWNFSWGWLWSFKWRRSRSWWSYELSLFSK